MATPAAIRVMEVKARTYRRTWRASIISTFLNPVLYLVSGFRWSFFGTADVPVAASLAAIVMFSSACLFVVWWMFRTGYRLNS